MYIKVYSSVSILRYVVDARFATHGIRHNTSLQEAVTKQVAQGPEVVKTKHNRLVRQWSIASM